MVTFHSGDQPGLVAGFGLYFIDADWPNWPTPGAGACSLKIFDSDGQELADSGVVSGEDAQQLFFGFVVADATTKVPLPVVARVLITAGSGWPEDENGEGVVLDDFVFSPLLPEIRITAMNSGSQGITIRWQGAAMWYFTAQFSSNLCEPSSWSDFPGYVDIPGSNDIMSATDANPLVRYQFYRIRATR